MTRRTNAKIAGYTFLAYIVIGISQMIIAPDLPGTDQMAARLQSMAQHESIIRLNMTLGLVTGFIAIALGIGLYGITRDEDHDLALFALSCRVVEGASVVIPIMATLGLLWLADNQTAQSPEAALVLGGFFDKLKGWVVTFAATFFAVGSTIFCWLLLRGRMIPNALSWLGLVASILLVIALPLQLAGITSPKVVMILWVPMAAFEIPLGLWLIIKGVK